MKKAIVRITSKVFEELLRLPNNVRIIDITKDFDFAYDDIYFVKLCGNELPDFCEVFEGQKIPKVYIDFEKDNEDLIPNWRLKEIKLLKSGG